VKIRLIRVIRVPNIFAALPVDFDTNLSAALRNSLSLTVHGTVRQVHFDPSLSGLRFSKSVKIRLIRVIRVPNIFTALPVNFDTNFSAALRNSLSLTVEP
jgi:type III secretory pathway component EscT